MEQTLMYLMSLGYGIQFEACPDPGGFFADLRGGDGRLGHTATGRTPEEALEDVAGYAAGVLAARAHAAG